MVFNSLRQSNCSGLGLGLETCGLGLGLGLPTFGLGLGLGLANTGLGLGLERTGLGLGLGLATAGLDYKTAFINIENGKLTSYPCMTFATKLHQYQSSLFPSVM